MERRPEDVFAESSASACPSPHSHQPSLSLPAMLPSSSRTGVPNLLRPGKSNLIFFIIGG